MVKITTREESIIQIHFSECWDETIMLEECEADEWLDELKSIIEDDSPKYVRLQRIVDNITGGNYNS